MSKLQYEETLKMAEKVASKLKGLSDYEKIKATHDYLAEICTYDLMKPGPYNLFYLGKANCTGYTSAFQTVMDKCKINCAFVSDEFHAWNVVKLDSQWYNMDITWDDQDDGIIYDYFLKGNNDFKDHIPNDLCNHASYNADLNFKYQITNLTNLNKYGIIILVMLIVVVLLFGTICHKSETSKSTTEYTNSKN